MWELGAFIWIAVICAAVGAYIGVLEMLKSLTKRVMALEAQVRELRRHAASQQKD